MHFEKTKLEGCCRHAGPGKVAAKAPVYGEIGCNKRKRSPSILKVNVIRM
jgi:hypothetical protein